MRSADPALRPPAVVWTLAVVGVLLLVVPVLALAADGGIQRLGDALASDAVRTALLLTLRTSIVATLIAVALGICLALVAERAPTPLARAAGVIGEAPLVIPPVVAGLALLVAFGREGLLGGLLDSAGLTITFTGTAVVLAQATVALPLVVLAVRAGLSSLDPAAEHAAAVHGATPWQVLRMATLPALRGSILLGAALGWGRAAGEFGATITFAGSLPGTTRTLPLEVFAELQRDPRLATAAALIQLLIAVAVLIVARMLRPRSRAWGTPHGGSS